VAGQVVDAPQRRVATTPRHGSGWVGASEQSITEQRDGKLAKWNLVVVVLELYRPGKRPTTSGSSGRTDRRRQAGKQVGRQYSKSSTRDYQR
jgi:hypothetical protein